MTQERPMLAFPIEEYEERIAKVRAAMERAGIDALLVFTVGNMYYLCGYDGTMGGYQYSHLLITRDPRPPVLVTHEVDLGTVRWSSWVEDVRTWRHGEAPEPLTASLLKEVGLDGATIGIEEEALIVSPASLRALHSVLPRAKFVDGTALLGEIRWVLSPREIAYMRDSVRHADEAYLAALRAVRVGATERDLAKAVTDSLYENGSSWSTAFCLSTGDRSVALHGIPTARRLREGDVVAMEPLGSVYHYTASILRTAVLGKAPAYLRTLHEVCAESVNRSIEAIAPGVPAGEIDRISREVTKKFDRYRCHRTGFAMGIRFLRRDIPRFGLLVGETAPLQAGMVLSIEPNFQDLDHNIGILLGDNVLVTETGHERLNRVPLDLVEVGL